MTNSFQVVASREIGQLPLSIGTSLAFESLFGILPDQDGDKMANVNAVYVNVKTILRNILASVPTESKKLINPEDLTEAIVQELEIIKMSLDKYSSGTIVLVSYLTTFKSFLREFKDSIPRYPKTELQKYFASLERTALKPFYEDGNVQVPVKIFDVKIADDAPRSLILTHQPVDLLWRYEFRKLRLLESHTGNVKDVPLWTTKLTGGKKLTRIPFNKMTIQVFGDGESFTGMPIKIKREVIRIAEEEKWTCNTTLEKMRYGISKAYDPHFKQLMFKLMK